MFLVYFVYLYCLVEPVSQNKNICQEWLTCQVCYEIILEKDYAGCTIEGYYTLNGAKEALKTVDRSLSAVFSGSLCFSGLESVLSKSFYGLLVMVKPQMGC